MRQVGLPITTSLTSTPSDGRTDVNIPIEQMGTPRLRERRKCTHSHIASQ